MENSSPINIPPSAIQPSQTGARMGRSVNNTACYPQAFLNDLVARWGGKIKMTKQQIKKIHQDYWLAKHQASITISKQIAVMILFGLCAVLYEYAGALYPAII